MSHPLSREFIQKLVRKEALKEVGHSAVFTGKELTLIKRCLKDSETKLKLRDRDFIIRYFTFKQKTWVTVRPVTGFVPMFSSSYEDVMKAEVI